MSAPSPGPDAEAQPESAPQHLHGHESQNPPMEAPAADSKPPEAPKEDDGREEFIRNLGTWIPDNRRTSLPKNPKANSNGIRNRETYSSFGDSGTTASVSAHGHLLQICRYFGVGRSGFFCVDQRDISTPWYSSSRLRDLLAKAQDSAVAFGIDWKGAFGDKWDFHKALPHLEFVDDRWPRFTSFTCDAPDTSCQAINQKETASGKQSSIHGLSRDFSLSVQYFCSDGTIFQRSTLKRENKTDEDLDLTCLELETGLLIRNLDFTERLRFNDKSAFFHRSNQFRIENDSLTVSRKIPKNRFEEMGIKSADKHKDVVLTIKAYVNGKFQAFCLDKDGQAPTISFSEAIQAQVKKFGVLDVLLTYSLRLKKINENKSADWDAMAKMCQDESYEKIIFSSHEHLDFLIRRNLEHILSVCSIPVASPTPESGDCKHEDSPIALTCGDISGHRVGTSASFYAIQFLQSMIEHLKSMQTLYAKHLKNRIINTYKRHLKWVSESTDPGPEGEQLAFSAHYWANGKRIEDTSYLPEPSLVDTPLQVLKFYGLSYSSEHARTRLWNRIVAWLQDLDQKDERKKYAFARMTSTEKEKFHLVDHVRIWQALSRIDSLGFDDNKVNMIKGRFDEGTVRKRILKRFITENPMSNRRMIATSRTRSETRFLLHSKDTALFYAIDSGIFYRKEKNPDEKNDGWKGIMDEWRNTIECQVEHQETQALEWRKPLWYAMSVILASKKRQINKTLSAGQLFGTATENLFDMSSPSGLFPGFLTESKEPMHFRNETYRDTYWQTTFEIPYILWKYGKTRLEAAGDRPLGNEAKSTGVNPSSITSGFMAKKLQFANMNKLVDPKGLVEISDDWLQPGPEALEFRPQSECRNGMSRDEYGAFIRKLDDFPTSADIVAYAAWESYHGKKRGKANSFTDATGEKALVADVPQGNEESKRERLKKPLLCNEKLLKLLEQPRDVLSSKKRLIWLPEADKETALICCLASPTAERNDLSEFFDRHALYDKYFSDETSAALNEWKTELHLSFYRLAEFTKLADFRQKEGIPKFSYVVPRPPKSQQGPAGVTGIVRATMGFRFVGDFFDRYWTCHFLEYAPGNPSSKPNSNDNFGRSKRQPTQTQGHTADSRSQPDPDTEQNTASSSTLQTGASKLEERMSSLRITAIKDTPTGKEKHPWQRRKVLELLLLDMILDEIKTETEKIFVWARDSVLRSPGDGEGDESPYSGENARKSVLGKFEHGDNRYSYEMAVSDLSNPLSEALDSTYQFLKLSESESYFNLISRWRLFENILETLGDDLDGNLDRISEWSNREVDREPESPRWTRNDERNFRNTIHKVRFQNQRKVRDLERLKVKIKAFRDSLTGRLGSIRDDKSFRGSENMSLFTYVTVVFLPLGFATGIFSMSGAPERLTLGFMVATAIISLLITVFALANAELLDDTIVEPLTKLLSSSWTEGTIPLQIHRETWKINLPETSKFYGPLVGFDE
ncbi:mg2+ transporter zinc transport protein [Diplodia corticola]|uniref:Mg2+ transporter zinc transport protein n=1 Tax=Diplodia corticola TaxID=236234 RepID=A0A1J9SG64_9PEZI|nr:mg2+ transporter zinc transport protein [Diplodia corticola]OJD38573.1 mg2+ transporter zinc transport protein [Diplodia corticola]